MNSPPSGTDSWVVKYWPAVAVVSPTQFVKNVANLHASLPKWDDKNWKGLTYHEAGYYKKKAEAAKQDKQNASKQSAAR